MAVSMNAVSKSNLQNALDTLTLSVSNLVIPSDMIKSGLSSSSSASSTSSSSSSSSSSLSQTASLNGTKHLNFQHSHYIDRDKSVTSNDQSCLMCPLCKKKLNEPKLLNCLHVFCKQCLIAHSMSDTVDFNHSSISCPKCKQETVIYENIESLQDDYIIHNILDMTAIEEMQLDCTSCKSDEKAIARCADCAQFLCPNCVQAHTYMRCFENHRVVKFDEIRSNYKANLAKSTESQEEAPIQISCGVPIHKPIFCKYHPNENLKFFCNTCQIPICTECVVNTHVQPMHSYERLNEAQSKNIDELEMMCMQAKEKIAECNGELNETLDKYLSELQEQLEQSRGLIEETHQSYKAILDKRKEDMLKELDEKHSVKELAIMELHNGVEQSIAQLNDAILFVNRVLVNGNCSEILLMKNIIVNQIKLLINNAPVLNTVDVNLKFISDTSQFEAAVSRTFGRFVTTKELKQQYLNNITIAEDNDQFRLQQQHQQQQMQKQLELQQQQEWLIKNMLTSSKVNPQLVRGLANYSGQSQLNEEFVSKMAQQTLQVPTYGRHLLSNQVSPSTAATDDWLRNIVKLPQNQLDEPLSTQQQLNHLHALSPPPSSVTSNTNTNTSSSIASSNPWLNPMPLQLQQQQQHQLMQTKLNAANSYSLSLAQQQNIMLNNLNNLQQQNNFLNIHKQVNRSHSPLEPNYQNMNNLHMQLQQQQQQQQLSRSQTPNLGPFGVFNGSSIHQTETANSQLGLDDFMRFSAFNPNKFNNPQTLMTDFLSSNLTDLGSITNSLVNNVVTNNNNNNSDTQSSSSQSPPSQLIQPIGTGIQANQSSFAGNGNLNPPVRQNGKMSNMQVRSKFGTLGSSKAQFNSPHGFCLGIDEEIIIADTNNHRIHIFEKNGDYKNTFGVPGKDEGQLWYPRKVTVMRETGKFVICDRGMERSRMQIFNKVGQFIKKISIRYIDIVAGMAITATGDIVAVDSVSPTVFRINEAGDLMKWFDCSEYMREPSDIAISGNEYYVCDFKGHCVAVFTDEGNFLRRIGGENITNFPNGIDVSDAGDVLVGDSHGNRFHVAVFSRDGTMISEFECPYVKVSRCCGLKITSEGYVVTLAKNNHHVLVLNTLYVC